MTASESCLPSRRRLHLPVLTAVALVLAALLASAIVSDVAYRTSLETGLTLEQRHAEALTAMRLAPWNATYRTREYVAAQWLSGSNLLAAGDYSGAVEALRPAYRLDVGDAPLLALFQRAQEIEALATTRKAHLQHGHEGPGSTLRPQDVER